MLRPLIGQGAKRTRPDSVSLCNALVDAIHIKFSSLRLLARSDLLWPDVSAEPFPCHVSPTSSSLGLLLYHERIARVTRPSVVQAGR
jgi:hypothetical protein